MAIVIGWSLLGKYVAGPVSQQVIEAVLLLGAGAAAFGLSAMARRSMVDIERTYSAHLEALSQRLRSLAYRDSLTGLYTHRYFYEQLTHELERSLRYGHPLSLLMIDLDRFKALNDTYGHLMGDKLLRLVADIISANVRGTDIVGRYGGDEFVVILPDTGQPEARRVADKLASAVRGGQTWDIPAEKLTLSISIGVASCPEDARTVNELLQVADRQLYQQKPPKAPSRALA